MRCWVFDEIDGVWNAYGMDSTLWAEVHVLCKRRACDVTSCSSSMRRRVGGNFHRSSLITYFLFLYTIYLYFLSFFPFFSSSLVLSQFLHISEISYSFINSSINSFPSQNLSLTQTRNVRPHPLSRPNSHPLTRRP